MAHAAGDLAGGDIEAYLAAHERKSMLRFITCGSVDDGKSTLIGRMLYESHLVFEDHLAALEADSKQVGTQGDDLDFALLVDGLSAEREQGITIDVAYRFFSTERRKFIVADTPGHEQYTRNMVTGATTADLAVILIDARKGVITQTRRHSYLVSLLGIRHVVLAVNKLDLVDWDETTFRSIERAYRSFAAEIGIEHVAAIPVSALRGDNVVEPSPNSPWYDGPTLLGHLETVDVDTSRRSSSAFRMPVQWVNRPDSDFRGYCGTVVAGAVSVGDAVVTSSGTASTVARIVTHDGDLPSAGADHAVTLVLADEIDVSRGEVLSAAADPVPVADQFEAHIVWMHADEMLPGRRYLMKLGTVTAGVTIHHPEHKIDVDTLQHVPAKTLHLNEIGLCTIAVDRMIPFEPYEVNRDLGGFVIIDRVTDATLGAGLIRHALRRSADVQWQAHEINAARRTELMGHRPAIVWFTGLSGAGKSTIADLTEQKLHRLGVHTMLLDGDNVRHGLSHDLGFTDADRVENIRRVAEVARLMADAGLVVLVAFISPFRAERALARQRAGYATFLEVFVDASLDVAEQRDVKGLYAKARRGDLANFTGIDSPYEAPLDPDVHLDSGGIRSADQCADDVVDALRRAGVI
ncbi:MAG: sulfate adenylyltransferase subunit CysN [Acidimicrobiales bacterium]